MINLKIATPEKTIYNDQIESFQVKTIDGEMTILPNHSPVLSPINDGYIIINDKKIDVINGMLIVNDDSTVDILISKM